MMSNVSYIHESGKSGEEIENNDDMFGEYQEIPEIKDIKLPIRTSALKESKRRFSVNVKCVLIGLIVWTAVVTVIAVTSLILIFTQTSKDKLETNNLSGILITQFYWLIELQIL